MKTVPQIVICFIAMAGFAFAAPEAPQNAMLRRNCLQCHNAKVKTGGINLEQLTAAGSLGEHFQHWERVAAALESKQMPPKAMPQPTDAERSQTVTWIRKSLRDYAIKHAGDPGRVTVRRLTSGEYAYALRDLTGVDFKFDDFGSDAVGGEGFTNFGDVQFMQDAGLERYLESAKRVANHAVIGSGPLAFYSDGGKSGFELSAINRIHDIYRNNGFRAASAEGGRPFGLERYAKAFYASWRYQNRAALGQPNATLESFAAKEGLSARFVQHIWSVIQQPNSGYPTSEVVAKFKSLPSDPAKAQAATAEIQRFIIDWPRWLFAAGALAAGGDGDERALVLTEESVKATNKNRFRFFQRGRRTGKTSRVYFSAISANPVSQDKPIVLWRNGIVRFRKADRSALPEQPLLSVLDEASLKKVNATGGGAFEIPIGGTTYLDMQTPDDAPGVELSIDAEIGPGEHGDAVVRCTVADREDLSKGRPPAWALLATPNADGFKNWKANVLSYAANFPQTSHGEPTPADRDPIPPPYNNAYNQPERDLYHTTVKYYRDDRFLVEKMLDDATRVKLENAWSDLLTSFEYHDVFLSFVDGKYKLGLKDKGIADLTAAQIEAFPAEAKQYVKALRTEYDNAMKRRKAAEPGHVEDILKFATSAWRRPLTEAEKQRLRLFYNKAREEWKLDHDKSIRLTLARVLVAPSFLYKLEQPPLAAGTVKPLSNTELASRISFFLWSSIPDEELNRAAKAGELNNPVQIEKQVRRMLADSKARRFSTEFFGQWLGFYRFDEYRGVDISRFPEFTDEVKSSMYDEAVSFFEHIVRKDKPVSDIFFADYTFLNKALAKHYGIKKDVKATDSPELVEGAGEFQRGGMLRLGAVLTTTSAPLRTSPVKRGDWILRRVLGTPTPPPPADAGSIPADEKLFGGLSLKEKLAAHQRNATCAGCHSRIDPLGFPLERYDAVGRWRDKYSDGKPVEDASVTADQKQVNGVNGLIDYLKSQDKQLMRTMSQKLLGYALGRTMLASDQILLDKLVSAGPSANFSKLVTEIVQSRQFRNVAGSPAVSQQPRQPQSQETGQ